MAIKESDAKLYRLVPAPTGMLLHAYLAVARAGDIELQGMLRAVVLPGWLGRAGLTDVRRHTTLLEFSAPLSDDARQQWRTYLSFMAHATEGLDLPGEDTVVWDGVRGATGFDLLMDDPDFFVCEGNTLVVGHGPGTKGSPG